MKRLTNPVVTIKTFKHGLSQNLPSHAMIGEFLVTMDTNELFVGCGDSTPIQLITSFSFNTTKNDFPIEGNSSIIYVDIHLKQLYIWTGVKYEIIQFEGRVVMYDDDSKLPSSDVENCINVVKNDASLDSDVSMYYYNISSSKNVLLGQYHPTNRITSFNIDNQKITTSTLRDVLKINSGVGISVNKTGNDISISKKSGIDITMMDRYVSPVTGGKIADMLTAKIHHCACIVGDYIYVFGGNQQGNIVYRYNTITRIWENRGIIPLPSANMTAMAVFSVDDIIYLTGGCTGTVGYNQTYIYHPNTHSLESVAVMNVTRTGMHYTRVGNKLWVISGRSTSAWNTTISSVEYFDLDTKTWTLLGPVYNKPTPTDFGSTFVIGNEIHCIGGTDKNVFKNTHEVFNTDTLTWSTKAPYPLTIHGTTAVCVNGLGYVFGGCNPSNYTVYRDVYMYNTYNDSWVKKENLTISRGYLPSIVKDNIIYLISGDCDLYNGYYTPQCEAYVCAIGQPVTKITKISLRRPLLESITNLSINYSNKDLLLHPGDIWECCTRKPEPIDIMWAELN